MNRDGRLAGRAILIDERQASPMFRRTMRYSVARFALQF